MKRITSIFILLVAMMVTFPMNTSAQRRFHRFYFDIILDNANNRKDFKFYASIIIHDVQDFYKGKKRDIKNNCDLQVIDRYGEVYFDCPILTKKELWYAVFLCNTVGYDEEENNVIFCDVSKRYYYIITKYKDFPAMKIYDKKLNKYWTLYVEKDQCLTESQRSYDYLMSIVKANNFNAYKIIKAKTSDILKKNLLK